MQWAAIAFVALTVVLGVAATGHVLGLTTIRPQYEKWVVGSFLFTLVASAAGGIKGIINPPPPESLEIRCGDKKMPAITSTESLRNAVAESSCQALVNVWFRELGYFDLKDRAVVDALAKRVPDRLDGESALVWRQRVQAAIDADPVTKELRLRAIRNEVPFQSITTDIDFGSPLQRNLRAGRPGQLPDRGEVFVSKQELDGTLLHVASKARPDCVLRLQARFTLTSVKDRVVALLHVNEQQQQHLFGGPLQPATAPGTIALAKRGEEMYDPGSGEECKRF